MNGRSATNLKLNFVSLKFYLLGITIGLSSTDQYSANRPIPQAGRVLPHSAQLVKCNISTVGLVHTYFE